MVIREIGHGQEGREIHLRVKRYKTDLARREADNEIKAFFTAGEPSQAFFPSIHQETQEAETVVFEAETVVAKIKTDDKVKTPGLNKRSGKTINSLLLSPDEFPNNNNAIMFIRNQFDRIRKFARTLNRKRKLSPQMQEILEV